MSRVVRATTAIESLQLLRVTRQGDRRGVHDLIVSASASFDSASRDTDAGRLADAVRALAPSAANDSIESFALTITRHLAPRMEAQRIAIVIEQRSWNRMALEGRPRDTDFGAGTTELRTAEAAVADGRETLHAGLRGMQLLTAAGGDTPQVVRIDARWGYGWTDVPYDTQWQQVRRALAESFTERQHPPGAELAHDMAGAILDQSPAVSEIEVTMRVQRLENVDLRGYGMESTPDVATRTGAGSAVYGALAVREELEVES